MSVFNWLFTPRHLEGLKLAEAVAEVLAKFEQCIAWEKKIHRVEPAISREASRVNCPLVFADFVPPILTKTSTPVRKVMKLAKSSRPNEDATTDSAIDTLRKAADLCPHLIFPETAFEAAARSPFRKTRRLYSILMSMESVAADWERLKGKLGRGWKEMFRERGVDYRSGISGGTLASYTSEYTFRYNGLPVVCGEHITLGVGMSAADCLSIHWHKDFENFKLFVPHVGRHMRCMTTN